MHIRYIRPSSEQQVLKLFPSSLVKSRDVGRGGLERMLGGARGPRGRRERRPRSFLLSNGNLVNVSCPGKCSFKGAF